MLKKHGGKYVKAAEIWGEKVVVARDGKLITGQNPTSGHAIAQAVWDSISA
jgi:putative intracellular protease/amidase